MSTKLPTVLSKLLEERHMTLKELSNQTKIKASTLSGWKNGVSPRDLTEVRICAQFFGVSMEKFLFNEESQTAPLNDLALEKLFDGYFKIKIERVLTKNGAK